MSSVEKEAISDFGDIFQDSYDRIAKEQDQLQKFFQKVNDWYYKIIPESETDKDELEKSERESIQFALLYVN